MLVEMFSDLVDKQVFTFDRENGYMSHLLPVFDKLGLMMPTQDEIHHTREGGLLLLLNEYGCAVRLYNHVKTNGRVPANTYHVYHTRSLPYLGAVRFPEFSMLVMPGAKLYDHYDDDESLSQLFEADINHMGDALVKQNIGYLPKGQGDAQTTCLIDTVIETRIPERYFEYMANNAEALAEHYAVYEDLQQAFHQAWLSDDPEQMQKFWAACKQELQSGNRITAGWLEEGNVVLDDANKDKKGFVAKACTYHQRSLSL